MLCVLMDGRAYTATELSVVADISPSTASAHLSRLAEERFVTCLSQGRHRYYQIAGPEVAELLERMMGMAWRHTPRPAVTTPDSLRAARTCYDHLAGDIAVKIYESMTAEKWLSGGGATLTPLGREKLSAIGVDCAHENRRRKFCCPCLDWSERRYHLAGELGASMLTLFERKGWVTRHLDSRGVTVSAQGLKTLRLLFKISI